MMARYQCAHSSIKPWCEQEFLLYKGMGGSSEEGLVMELIGDGGLGY